MPRSLPEAYYFVTVSFMSDGSILLSDADGSVGEIGQYETGRVLPLAVAIDLDAHNYDVWLDSKMVIDDETIASMTDQGVEMLLFGTVGDAELLGRFHIDDLRVTDNPDAVPVLAVTWGTIRTPFAR